MPRRPAADDWRLVLPLARVGRVAGGFYVRCRVCHRRTEAGRRSFFLAGESRQVVFHWWADHEASDGHLRRMEAERAVTG